MANEHSISNNPIFQNSGHSFSELFALLPKLQAKATANGDLNYSTDTNTLKAIYHHADDASVALLSGLQSLGVLLATAADNQDMGLSLGEVSAVGWLIRGIGDLLTSCTNTKDELSDELFRRGVIL